MLSCAVSHNTLLDDDCDAVDDEMMWWYTTMLKVHSFFECSSFDVGTAYRTRGAVHRALGGGLRHTIA